MLRRFLLVVFVGLSLYGKEILLLNDPTTLPSTQSQTSMAIALIKQINKAQHEIDFAIYGLRSQNEILQALINAKNRGVIIKGVVDSDSHDKNYYSDTAKLSRYFQIVSDHTSHIMHNKFFIFDKKILWSGSSNISDTGTGGYNVNNVMIVEDEKIAKLYYEEFTQMFDKKLFGKKKKQLGGTFQTDQSKVKVYFSPKSNTYESGIEQLIQNARHYIYIPIFYLTHKDLADELVKANKRGVEIKIILDASAANNKYSMHKMLRENGIAVKVENFGGKMHAKSMIIDDEYFISGSMNFTKAGVSSNDENTIIVKNRKLTKQYKDFFLTLWRKIPEKYSKFDPKAESLESINSCYDGVDNDFDREVDIGDKSCG